jgi:hypothetical protein
MNQSLTKQDTLLLLSLPREIIYKIAAEDTGVYNVVLRLCRYTSSLFPLSMRLDFMEAFGVCVEINKGVLFGITWYWDNKWHDIFGPSHESTDRRYYSYRGYWHREHLPARVWRDVGIQWYHRGVVHRDMTAPVGTGVRWLAGAASIVRYSGDTIDVVWYHHGQVVRKLDFTKGTEGYTQAHAEMNYWLTQEYQ